MSTDALRLVRRYVVVSGRKLEHVPENMADAVEEARGQDEEMRPFRVRAEALRLMADDLRRYLRLLERDLTETIERKEAE